MISSRTKGPFNIPKGSLLQVHRYLMHDNFVGPIRNVTETSTSRIANPDPVVTVFCHFCRPFHPGLRIRTFLVGSGSGAGFGKFPPDPRRILSVLWQCKVVKIRKKYFLNRAFTHFQVNFSLFFI